MDCPVCLLPFADAQCGILTCTALECGQSVCQACVDGIRAHGPGGRFACPMCRASPARFVPNRTLEDMLGRPHARAVGTPAAPPAPPAAVAPRPRAQQHRNGRGRTPEPWMFMARRDEQAGRHAERAARTGRKSMTYAAWRQAYPGGYPMQPNEIVEVVRSDRAKPHYVKRCPGGVTWCSCDEWKRSAPAKACRHTRLVRPAA